MTHLPVTLLALMKVREVIRILEQDGWRQVAPTRQPPQIPSPDQGRASEGSWKAGSGALATRYRAGALGYREAKEMLLSELETGLPEESLDRLRRELARGAVVLAVLSVLRSGGESSPHESLT